MHDTNTDFIGPAHRARMHDTNTDTIYNYQHMKLTVYDSECKVRHTATLDSEPDLKNGLVIASGLGEDTIVINAANIGNDGKFHMGFAYGAGIYGDDTDYTGSYENPCGGKGSPLCGGYAFAGLGC
jgi:hypothetical protein